MVIQEASMTAKEDLQNCSQTLNSFAFCNFLAKKTEFFASQTASNMSVTNSPVLDQTGSKPSEKFPKCKFYFHEIHFFYLPSETPQKRR
jgi:hypothetical protein